MDNYRVERTTVDGRRGETHVIEQVTGAETSRVTTHFEEKVPLEMRQRVSERVVPVVLERITEQFDANGGVNKTVERVNDYDRLAGLNPSQQCATKEDIENMVQKAVAANRFHIPFFNKAADPAPTPTPAPAPAPSSGILGYILVAALAVEVGLLVWQLFLR